MDELYIEFKNLGIETCDPVLFCKNNELLCKLEDISKRFLSVSLLDGEWRKTDHFNLTEVFVQSSERFLNNLRKLGHGQCKKGHLELLRTSNALLKMVRNSFAGNDGVDITSEKFEQFFITLNHTLEDYVNNPGVCEKHINERLMLLRCCLQVLANVSSSSDVNANMMLKQSHRHLIEFITSEEIEDIKLKVYATAALHSALVRVHDALSQLNQCSPGFNAEMLTRKLLSTLVNSDDDDDEGNDGRMLSEWSLYVFKLLLKSSNYLDDVWESLTVQERIFTIEVLSSDCEILNSQSIESEKSLTNICHQSNIDYLCLEMTNQITSFIQGHDKVTDTENCSHPLLCLLSEVSSLFHLLTDLKNTTTLLIQSVDLLKILQSASQNQKDDLSRDDKILMSEIRRDLIKLIANLVYRNKVHQDLMRDNGGLYMILNMTVIDSFCPTIQQWSLFAINNLCEDNQENRKFISNLKLDRVADVAKDLKNAGVNVEVKEGKLHFSKPDQ